MCDFLSLGIDARLDRALQDLKLSKPTEVQKQAIPFFCRKKTWPCNRKPGTGKTLAYLLPIFHMLLDAKSGHS